MALPFCSVIVLNYYGESVIKNVIGSLLELDYPKNKFEIIIVDNNSKDGSKNIILDFERQDKRIEGIFLKENLGFSAGNNIGIKSAKGKYVLLLNNDCLVDSKWLRQLVTCAEIDKQIFAVGSKILLYPKFTNIGFSVDQKLTPFHASLSASNVYDSPDSDSKLIHLSPWRIFSDDSTDSDTSSFQIEIPHNPYKDDDIDFNLLFSCRKFKIKNNELENLITFENKAIKILKVIRNESEIEYKLHLKLSAPEIRKQSFDKIQNAGIVVFQDGYGRDIGAIVRYSQQYYETDRGQYNQRKEIYGACGAAVLYNKKILQKAGLLDEKFFMYYEDLDISERARLLGYKIFYEPSAVVRHHHALSSKEWSPFFVYHTEKGRLLHVFYNFPLRIFIKEYFYVTVKSFITMLSLLFKLRAVFYNVRTKRIGEEEPKYARRIQVIIVLFYFVFNFPLLIFRRYEYMKKINNSEIEKNYRSILKGEWYFS